MSFVAIAIIAAAAAAQTPCKDGLQPDAAVTLSFTIEVDGKVSHVRVVKATSRDYGAQAVKAVKHWRYKPKTDGTHPTKVEGVQIEIYFCNGAQVSD